MEYSAPNLIPTPFASDGDKNTIAQSYTDPSSGNATYQVGFPPITQLPRASGGLPPSRADMNGILYDITSNIMYTNAGGQARFNQDFCTAIGGYPKGAVLQDYLGEKSYVSLVDNNTVNFNTTSYEGYWEEHGAGGVKTINNMTPDANGNISVSFPVTSVNGKTGAVIVGTVRSINGLNPDAAGNVTIGGGATANAYVTETWQSGTEWYRKWSDGRIEQGGYIGNGTNTVTLHKAFTSANYTLVTGGVAANADDMYAPRLRNLTTTNFNIYVKTNYTGSYWYAAGK